MTTAAPQILVPPEAPAFASDDDRWRAVLSRDPAAAGCFFYAVRTTGVYCRPGCASRRPRRENVTFHATATDAERAGFRPCRRCRPDEFPPRSPNAAAVARACRMIAETDPPPPLDALADGVGMSASHFRRVFRSHTGLTPKAYAAAHRSRRVREELAQRGSVTAAFHHAGFGSSGRFYDAAPKVLGMKPTAYKAGGAGVTLRFAVGECSLGSILVGASAVGICAIDLGDDPETLVRAFQDRFPNAELVGGDEAFEHLVAQAVALVDQPSLGLDLPLDIRGTAFQERVWRKLRDIPRGQTRSYTQLARELGVPRATRAVAHACAANRIAVAIPCHRVVRTDGALAGYRWGIERKAALLDAERAARGSRSHRA